MTANEIKATLLANGWQESRKKDGTAYEKAGNDAVIAIMDTGAIVIAEEASDGTIKRLGRCDASECFINDGRIFAGAWAEV